MYAPPGLRAPEVGDVDVVAVGDTLHMTHLTLPNRDIVQHAISTDGLAWRRIEPAVTTGDPGEPDDDQIGTMSVTEHNGMFYMLYTGRAKAERALVERTVLATSTDLVTWTKHAQNPISEADARWYETELVPGGSKVSWRDHKPWLQDGHYFATISARERGGPVMRRGCAGLLVSDDLISWEARPPLFAPRHYWDLECPQLFEIGGHWYLTAATMEDRRQRYWTASAWDGPYRVPADGGILAPTGHYAGRVHRRRDLDLFWCWHLADYDWPGGASPFGKYAVAPLVLERRADGSLAKRTFPGWAAYRDRAPDAPAAATSSLFRGVSLDPAAPWALRAANGMDVVGGAELVGDFWWSGQLHLSGRAGGLAFRLEEDGTGYLVEIQDGGQTASLQKWLLGRDASGRPTFKYTELQRGRLATPVTPGAPVAFELLVVGAYIECSLGGEVVLATLSAERTRGRFGAWVESGEVRVEGGIWAPMRAPEHH
jgi:beta-fructofuranosidase